MQQKKTCLALKFRRRWQKGSSVTFAEMLARSQRPRKSKEVIQFVVRDHCHAHFTDMAARSTMDGLRSRG
eukprot:1158006-Pelagomonas_calceolata.AAC.10